jgi:hypothetical protein
MLQWVHRTPTFVCRILALRPAVLSELCRSFISPLLPYIECSLWRLVGRPDTGISQQTEGHSFGDHLISDSVCITPSSVTEASIMLCSVSL